tara:strand:+ start:335 stop:682 length:348 start_codon:yes stop_codon:yes gene_type:complete
LIKNLFKLFSFSKNIINPNNISENLKNDKYLTKEFLKSILSNGKIKIIKLKKKIIIFLSKILSFFKSLKLYRAYKEKIIEKQFNASEPIMIKIGNSNIDNCKIKLIFRSIFINII